MEVVWYALAGTAFVGGVAAVAWNRLRARDADAPTGVRRFLELLREVVDCYPNASWGGLLPERFAAVVVVDGQETPVGLRALHRAYEDQIRRGHRPQEVLPPLVAQLVGEVRSEGLETLADHPFGDVAGDLLPQIRTTDWLQEHGGAFGDWALVHRPLTEDLVVTYVVDRPFSMTFVCQQHLAGWGCTVDAVHQLALQNLRARSPLPGAGESAWMSRAGDGYDASRLLLLDPTDHEGALVAVPERDTLWMGRPSSVNRLGRLMQLTQQQCDAARHPISPRVYRLHAAGLEVVPEG